MGLFKRDKPILIEVDLGGDPWDNNAIPARLMDGGASSASIWFNTATRREVSALRPPNNETRVPGERDGLVDAAPAAAPG